MTSSSSPVSSSSSKQRTVYDAFLSFRGVDTRKTFVDHLYEALDRKGIYTFKDDVELAKGKYFELLKKIEVSRIAIIVFTKNYTCSSWCLDELEHIMHCHTTIQRYYVIPVFYDVDPSDVRDGTVGDNVATHANVEKWREALIKAANLGGWVLKNTADGHEAKFIKEIVESISKILEKTTSSGDEKLVGIKPRIKDVKSLLQLELRGFGMIGIWGMGGAGKTSIARAVFNDISSLFEGRSFIENVTKASEMYGLITLQEKLLSDVLEKDLKLRSVVDGQRMISHRLANKNVLVVLDDVNHANQIEALCGYGSWFGKANNSWFGEGSRVIITTRDRQVLVACGVKEKAIYNVTLLNDDESIHLFSRYAFGTDIPTQDYEVPSQLVVEKAFGLPLTLKVLGGYLRGRDRVLWTSALNKLQKIPEKETLKALEISYNGLEDVQKEVFLDIACFFRGLQKDLVIRILDSCEFESSIILDDLEKKSLITMKNNLVEMHDLIQKMGRNAVHQEAPGRCSRLWCSSEVCDVLQANTGMEDIKAIVVQPEANFVKMNEFRNMNNEAFTKMKKLRLLYLKCNEAHFQEPTSLPNELRWLTWDGFPLHYLPESFRANKLVGLELCKSNIAQLWESEKLLENLKFLNLDDAKSLIKTPDFSNMPNLVSAKLNHCSNLREVHMSSGVHNELVCLELAQCMELESFPDTIEMKKLEKLNMCGCSKLKKFPEFIGHMGRLSDLVLAGSSVEELPLSIGNLPNLVQLDLHNCRNLMSLPHTIGNLKCLKTLDLRFCSSLLELPDNLRDMECLRHIKIRSCPSLHNENLPKCVLRKTNPQPNKNIKISNYMKHGSIIMDVTEMHRQM